MEHEPEGKGSGGRRGEEVRTERLMGGEKYTGGAMEGAMQGEIGRENR